MFIKSPLKGLFILFYFIVVFGLFLLNLNLELFTSFLWFLEFTLIFLTLLFIFQSSLNITFYKKYNILISCLAFAIVAIFYIYLFNSNFFFNTTFNYIFWSTIFLDYYSLALNLNLNDLFGFYLSYYIINYLSLLIILMLLLFTSLLCIFLLRANNKKNFFLNLSFVFNFISKNFLRKQSLFKQSNLQESTVILKKK